MSLPTSVSTAHCHRVLLKPHFWTLFANAVSWPDSLSFREAQNPLLRGCPQVTWGDPRCGGESQLLVDKRFPSGARSTLSSVHVAMEPRQSLCSCIILVGFQQIPQVPLPMEKLAQDVQSFACFVSGCFLIPHLRARRRDAHFSYVFLKPQKSNAFRPGRLHKVSS